MITAEQSAMHTSNAQQKKAFYLLGHPLSAGQVWHFEPQRFIEHFRRSGWLGKNDFLSVVRRYQNAYPITSELRTPLTSSTLIVGITNQGLNNQGEIVRPDDIKTHNQSH